MASPSSTAAGSFPYSPGLSSVAGHALYYTRTPSSTGVVQEPVSRQLWQGRPAEDPDVWRHVAQLEERLSRQETEVSELRSVISTKDGIIRMLGAKLGEAEMVKQVVQAKDQIIRELGKELSTAKPPTPKAPQPRAEAGPLPARAAATSSPLAAQLEVQAPPRELPPSGDADSQASGTKPFTVLPVGDDSVYEPCRGSVVDARIAAFTNSRRCRILFTRVDNEDHYLYGRLLVRCVAQDGVTDGVLVWAHTSRQWLELAAFVEQHEHAEYLQLERAFNPMFNAAVDALQHG